MSIAELVEKACTRCGEPKPLEEFYRSKREREGRLQWCKPCHNAWKQANRRVREPRRPPRSDEVITHAMFKSLRWPLDDALAEAITPGLVMHLRITLRFEDVADYANKTPASWVTSVLRSERCTTERSPKGTVSRWGVGVS